jgi:O-antigen/teichoic acid export membrane protein
MRAGRPVAGSIAAGVYGQAALVVTGVIVARSLGPVDRGHIAFLLLLPSVLRQVGTLGLPSATTFFIARNNTLQNEIVRAIRAPVILQVVLLTTLQGVLLWALVQDEPSRVRTAGLLTLGLLASGIALDYGLAILQGQGRYLSFNILRVLPVTAYAAAIVLLVLLGEAELISIMIAWVGANLCVAGVTVAVAASKMSRASGSGIPPSRRQLLRFGLKGLPGSASSVETFRVDQAVIGLFLNPAALGLYVAGLSFTNLPRFIAQSIGMVAFPQVARGARESAKRLMWRFCLLATILITVVVVMLELAAGWLVPFFFGREFAGSVGLTRILLVGALFFGIRRVLSDAAKGAGHPGLGTIAEFVSWLSLLPLLVIFVPHFGVEGVAAALAISSGLSLATLVITLLRRPTMSEGAIPRSTAQRLRSVQASRVSHSTH